MLVHSKPCFRYVGSILQETKEMHMACCNFIQIQTSIHIGCVSFYYIPPSKVVSLLCLAMNLIGISQYNLPFGMNEIILYVSKTSSNNSGTCFKIVAFSWLEGMYRKEIMPFTTGHNCEELTIKIF